MHKLSHTQKCHKKYPTFSIIKLHKTPKAVRHKTKHADNAY